MGEGSFGNAPNGLRYIKHLSMRRHHLVTTVEALEIGITLKSAFQCMEILDTCEVSTLVHFVM